MAQKLFTIEIKLEPRKWLKSHLMKIICTICMSFSMMAIDPLFENGSKVKPGDSKPVDSKFQALAAYQN